MKLACLLYPEKYSDSEMAKGVLDLYNEALSFWGTQRADWKANEKRASSDFWEGAGAQDQLLLSFPELSSVIRRHSGLLTERIPRIVAYPASPNTSQQDADLMSAVFQSLYLSQSWDIPIRKMVEDALVYSVGFVEVGWSYANSLPTLVEVSPWDIYPEPHAATLDDAAYVVKQFSLYGYEIVHRYEIDEDDLAKLQAVSVAEDRASRDKAPKRQQYTTTDSEGTHQFVYIDQEPETLRLDQSKVDQKKRKAAPELLERRYRLLECWVKQVSGIYLSYVVSGNFLVSGPNKEGKHLKWQDYRWWDRPKPLVYGISLVKLLSSLQRLINTLGSGAALNLEKVMDPLEVMEISVAEAQRNDLALPGQRILTPDGAINGIKWLEPPHLPPELFRLIEIALEATNRATGVDPLGLRDIQVRRQSATEVEAFHERQQSVVLQDARLLEHSLERIATTVMCLFAELQTSPVTIPAVTYVYSREKIELEADRFMVAPKVLSMEDGGAVFEELPPKEPMEFVAQVEIGSTMATSRQARETLGLSLYDRQIIDAEVLLTDFLDLPQAGVILNKMRESQSNMLKQIRAVPQQPNQVSDQMKGA